MLFDLKTLLRMTTWGQSAPNVWTEGPVDASSSLAVWDTSVSVWTTCSECEECETADDQYPHRPLPPHRSGFLVLATKNASSDTHWTSGSESPVEFLYFKVTLGNFKLIQTLSLMQVWHAHEYNNNTDHKAIIGHSICWRFPHRHLFRS